ncbi:MAG: diphthamide synthesis protein [Candidatus Woesearchaeota archaeon]|nr:MAG: diphthamide synthesis protein [Candidatus Woesearchaeota archaeon]
MKHNLNSDELAKKIGNARKVVLQFPDGLKNEAREIALELEKKTNAEIFLWMGSNFGGCDYPFYLEKLGFDLLINIGHNSVSTKI